MGQTSTTQEQTSIKNLVNLLNENEELKPSHVMLQINFGDMNSSFYFEGPSFGSENGFDKDELYRIIIGVVMQKLWSRLPNWVVHLLKQDCSQPNTGFIAKCMCINETKLIHQKILKFRNPYTGTSIFVIHCGDHVAKSVRNEVATSYEGSKQYIDIKMIFL